MFTYQFGKQLLFFRFGQTKYNQDCTGWSHISLPQFYICILIPRPLVLASRSVSRARLLTTLGIAYDQYAPDVDETPRPGEDIQRYVERLSLDKATKVAQTLTGQQDRWLIAGDQAALVQGEIEGKPRDENHALDILQRCAATEVQFHSGLCLMNSHTRDHEVASVITKVRFCHLSKEEIESYVRKVKPFASCAGFVGEHFGMALVESMQSSDPTAMYGLPLTVLCRFLREKAGHNVLLG